MFIYCHDRMPNLSFNPPILPGDRLIVSVFFLWRANCVEWWSRRRRTRLNSANFAIRNWRCVVWKRKTGAWLARYFNRRQCNYNYTAFSFVCYYTWPVKTDLEYSISFSADGVPSGCYGWSTTCWFECGVCTIGHFIVHWRISISISLSQFRRFKVFSVIYYSRFETSMQQQRVRESDLQNQVLLIAYLRLSYSRTKCLHVALYTIYTLHPPYSPFTPGFFSPQLRSLTLQLATSQEQYSDTQSRLMELAQIQGTF